jgi:hypothetical protein
VKNDWAKNWNFSDAVTRLALAPALYESVDNYAACLPKVINDGFEGRFGRVQERQDMKPLAMVLPNVVDRLRRKMVSVGLDQDAKMPPVLWLRLMREVGLKPVDVAEKDFERWQDQTRANGMTILYLRFDEDKQTFVGPSRLRDGLGKIPGYSVDEMIAEQRKPRRWPYRYRWKCVCKASTSADVPPVVKVGEPKSDTSTPIPLGVPKRRTATSIPKQRRKRSRQALERACGTRLILALEGCLSKEVELKKSVVVTGGRNRRAYGCQLSLDELVAVMKRKYHAQLNCAESTLKSALPHFVSCPRGRPGGIAGLE